MKYKIYITIISIIVIVVSLALIVTKKKRESEVASSPFRRLFPNVPLTSKSPDYQARERREFLEVEDEPEYRSKIVLSPDGCYGAYISPLEWEAVGNLFVKNIKTGEVNKLTHYRENRSNTPKAVVWLNDTLLLVIEGYTWGTVTVGGSLYVVNSRTGKFYSVLKPPIHQEVAEVSTHKNSIVLKIATWSENYMDYKLSTKVLQVDSILNSLIVPELTN